MNKATEYRVRANECRAMAARMPPGDQQAQLLAMAKAWESLAEDRERLVRNATEPGAGRSPGDPRPPKNG